MLHDNLTQSEEVFLDHLSREASVYEELEGIDLSECILEVFNITAVKSGFLHALPVELKALIDQLLCVYLTALESREIE
jgi:hypothetical protein